MKEEKKLQNEELQSRREFFKKAAKGVLPVLGAIALMNMPLLSQAKEINTNAMGCNWCKETCTNVCTSCYGSCTGDCRGLCQNGCKSCTGSCQGRVR